MRPAFLPGALALTLGALGAAGTAGAGALTFQPVVTTPRAETTAPGVDRIVAGDLNGDGRADLIAGTSPVVARLGTAGGAFASPVTIAADGSEGMRLVDVNGDHDPDLILNGATALAVAIGGAGDSFGPATTIGPPAAIGGAGAAEAPAVADLNGDGDPDLAYAKADGSGVVVILGAAGATFGAPVTYLSRVSEGVSTEAARVADVNGDHDPDIIGLLAAGSGRIVVLAGGAGGTFTEAARFDAVSIGDLAVGDVNGDSDADLVTTDANGPVLRLGRPGAVFGAPVSYAFGQPSSPPDVEDVNGDGRADVWALGSSDPLFQSSTLRVRLGSASGVLGVPVESGPFFPLGARVFADLDGDGRPELVEATTEPETQVVLLRVRPGSASALFAPGAEAGLGTGTSGAVTVGDIDGDGRPDVVALAGLASGHVIAVWRQAPPAPAAFPFHFLPGTLAPPATNLRGAGSRVVIRFRLGGDRGPHVIAAGGPYSRRIGCRTGRPLGPLEPAAGRLQRGVRRGVYVYRWRTSRRWKRTCRRFALPLVDGTAHRARFRFR